MQAQLRRRDLLYYADIHEVINIPGNPVPADIVSKHFTDRDTDGTSGASVARPEEAPSALNALFSNHQDARLKDLAG